MDEEDVLEIVVKAFTEAFKYAGIEAGRVDLTPLNMVKILKADKSEMEKIKGSINPEQVKYIIQLLRENEKGEVRKVCAIVLRRLGREEAVDPLIEALGDEDRNVRHSAAYGMGKLERYITNGRFKRIMNGTGDRDWRVREAHCSALGFMKEAVGGMGRRGILEALIYKLEDTHPMVRARAAFSIGNLGKVLRMKKAAAIKPLIEKLDDPESIVRTAAVHALGELRDYSASEPLIIALGDVDQHVREAAGKAVVKVAEIGKVFVDALADRKVDLSKLATYANVLEKLAKSEHPETSKKAGELLSKVKMDPESRSKYTDSVKRLKIMNSFTTNPGFRIRKKTPS